VKSKHELLHDWWFQIQFALVVILIGWIIYWSLPWRLTVWSVEPVLLVSERLNEMENWRWRSCVVTNWRSKSCGSPMSYDEAFWWSETEGGRNVSKY